MNESYKFMALSEEEWLSEKKLFIENKDKTRNLIDESILKSSENNDDETLTTAQDIFGDIIEVN